MKNPALIAAAGLLAYGAWKLSQQAQDINIEEVSGAVQDFGENIVSKTVNALGLWRAPAKYASMIASAENQQGLPATMLERLLYQECRYREDIITGKVRSGAGAMGIAQFMPATAAELGIDPLDPAQAIPAAAKYLRGLFNKFGTWSEALAAYNWGQGNVQRKGLAQAPRETVNYYTQILADVNSATGSTYA
jgi:soluble lytic murein transglycosylase-like protein